MTRLEDDGREMHPCYEFLRSIMHDCVTSNACDWLGSSLCYQ